MPRRPNKLTPPVKATFLQKVWAQLNSVVIWMLFASAIVKGALQQWPEFGLILAVIIVNTAIGLIQEGRAEQAAAAIMAMLSANARVLRDGEQAIVPAEELVPGDIVLLKSGDKVNVATVLYAYGPVQTKQCQCMAHAA